jgi:Fe-S-cluster-containing hydrogenase component 2
MQQLKNDEITTKKLKEANKYPTEVRMQQGPVAVIECIEEIPCNPCEKACKCKAIIIGDPITNLPHLIEDKCIGCGACISQCSGLAIFVVDKSYSQKSATVSFPYEYVPLPKKGSKVKAVNRLGEVVCTGIVKKVVSSKKFDKTSVVTLEVPYDMADEVRSMKNLSLERG